ncbi:MAG: ABC transporter substrate-binding protein [Pseudomonadota bacterium]
MTLLAGVANADELKIGALLPLTGDLQAFGEANLNGVRLAEEQINEAGGVNGAPIQLVVADTQTSPVAGVDAAQKLVNVDGVHGIVGAMGSGVTIPVATSVTSRAGVVTISPSATSPTITTLDDNGYLFRTAPSDAYQGAALANLVMGKGTKTVSIIYVNNDYGEGLANAFQTNYEKAGGSVAQSVAFEQGQPSYRGEVQRAAQGDSEALIVIAYPESGQVILTQALEGGHFTNFIFTDGMKDPGLIELIGADFLDGAYGTMAAAAESPQLAAFVSAYQPRFGDPLAYVDGAYDAMMLIALAAQKAGSNDRTAIRDALREVSNPPGEEVGPGEFAKAVSLLKEGKDINYQGAAGSQDFDENGDVPGRIGEWRFSGDTIEEVGEVK